MNIKIEIPPRGFGGGEEEGGSSHCLRRRPLFLSLTGHAIISLKSQRSISIGDLYRTIALIVDDHLGGPRPLFDLIEVITMGHGKVNSMSSFFFMPKILRRSFGQDIFTDVKV